MNGTVNQNIPKLQQLFPESRKISLHAIGISSFNFLDSEIQSTKGLQLDQCQPQII